jgi:hypothetical protein
MTTAARVDYMKTSVFDVEPVGPPWAVRAGDRR